MKTRARWILAAAIGAILCAEAWLTYGATYPRDDSGTPAAQCAFIGTAGAPVLCSATDPLPTSGAGSAPTTSTTDPSGWGLKWANSTNPVGTGLIPFVPVFVSDNLIYGFAPPTAANGFDLYVSTNHGATWTFQGTVTRAVGASAQPQSAMRLTNGAWVIGTRTTGGTTPADWPLGIWNANGTFTQPTLTGIGAGLGSFDGIAVAQSGSTLLANLSRNADGSAYICRSTDAGLNWACYAAGGTVQFQSAATLAKVGTAWVYGSDAGVYRSTNDGTSFGQVFAQASTKSHISCLSDTVCVWTAGAAVIYRSANAGLTWGAAFTAPGTSPQFSGFVNYGGGRVAALPGVTGNRVFLSTDYGVTWAPVFAFSATQSCGSPCNTTVFNGSAVTSLSTATATSRNLFSSAVPPGGLLLVGATGVPANVDSAGRLATSSEGNWSVATGNLVNNGDAVTVPLGSGLETVAVILAGAWTGTVTSECSVDGATFFTCFAYGTSSNINFLSVTANTTFLVHGGGYRAYRVRATAAMTGTVNVTLNGFRGVRIVTLATAPAHGYNVAPVQSVFLANSVSTAAANTPVVVTLAATSQVRHFLRGVSAYCSAGTASLTVADVATIWQTPAGAIGTTLFSATWPTALSGASSQALTITLGTCGAGNTGTLIIQADRAM
jgi:hypothetical protein